MSREGAAGLRCFVAAFLEADSARRLQSAALAGLDPQFLDARVARPVPVRNFHVTLKFLGELDAPAVARALDAVNDLDGCRAQVQVTGLTAFPAARAARLVAARVAEHGGLEAWWASLQRRLGAEECRFRPHVTLLRLRRPRRFDAANWREWLPLTLEAPRLYRSDRTAAGMRYRPLPPG